MSQLESKLVVRLQDLFTGPARAIRATIDRLSAAGQRNAARMQAVQGQLLGAAGAGYALYRGLSAPVNAAIDFESAMADVRKVVTMDDAGFAKLGADIRGMSRSMPMAADQIAAMVAAAGQSGIANADLTKFAELATKVGVAWDIGAEQSGDALAKLKSALGLSLDDTGSLADAINHLGNNSAASAPQILDVVRRVAPMAKQFGLNAEQVAAFGAAMTGAGFESEVASTSLLNMGKALTKGGSATARQTGALKKLGLTSKGTAKAMQKDAVGTITDVLARIQKIAPEARAALVSDLFGDEARALGPLITNGKLLADTLALIGDKTAYAGSAQAEYDARSKTSANNIQLFKNRIADLGISIGNALLPPLNSLLGIVGPIVSNLSDLAGRFPQITAGIAGLAAAIVGFRVAALGFQYAALFVKAGVIGMARAALVLAATPLGATLTAIALAGTWIANNWRAVSGLFESFGIAFMAAIAPIRPALEPLISFVSDWAGRVSGFFSGLLGPVSGLEWQFRQFGGTVGNALGNAVRYIVELPAKVTALAEQMYSAGHQIAQRLYDGVVAKVDELVAWFSSLPSRILAAIGSIDIGSLIKWPSMPSWLGGGSGEPAPAVDGARADGGPVGARRTYLVGERGPELFTPSGGGRITSNSAMQSMSRAGGGIKQEINLTISTQAATPTDIRAAVEAALDSANRKLADSLGRQTQLAAEGGFHDGSV